jgi:hypothetical protein
VDSFSEYIVRNTIKRNILKEDDKSFFPIITRGYKDGDYAYYSDGYSKYYSNITLQTIPATAVAKLFKINTDRKLDAYFGLLRLINAFLFSFFLTGVLFYFCKQEKLKQPYLIPLLVGSSSGFIFFSQNLYFLSFLVVAPAFFIANQLLNKGRFNNLILLFLGVLYFLNGYEFATVFALLTAFIAALFTLDNLARKLRSAALAFGIICVAFFVSLIIHVILVSADSGWALSLSESFKLSFSSVQERTSSLSGVPAPFSTSFLTAMNWRWSHSAFSITNGGFLLTELNVILLMMAGAVFRLGKMTENEKIIYCFGLLGYASWYVFAYQHIMWHHQYDWYIFSLTTGLSFSMLVLYYTQSFLGVSYDFLVGRRKNV